MPNPEMRISLQPTEIAKRGNQEAQQEQKSVVNLSPDKVFGLYKYLLAEREQSKLLDEAIKPILNKIRDHVSLSAEEKKIVDDYYLLRRTRNTVVEWLKERSRPNAVESEKKEYKTFAENIQHLREEQTLISQDYDEIEAGIIHRVESALRKDAPEERVHRWERKWYEGMNRIFSQLKEKYTERGIDDIGEQVGNFLRRIAKTEKIQFSFDIELYVRSLIAARKREVKESKAMQGHGKRTYAPRPQQAPDQELDALITVIEESLSRKRQAA